MKAKEAVQEVVLFAGGVEKIAQDDGEGEHKVDAV